jgi:uncharacterized phiE125 gp8 family phage protein
MIYWPAKAPGANLSYKLDFSGALGTGVSITGVSVAATGVTVVGTPTHDATSVTVEIEDGTLGTPGIIVCTITTDDPTSPTDVETAILPIGEEPVTLDMAKRQCRLVGTTDKDDLLLELIPAAREHVERYCGIRVVPAALAMTFDHFSDLESLSRAPVQSITSIQYYDANGVQQTLDPSVYEFVNTSADELRPAIRLAYNQQWPPIRAASDVITVSAVVGYTAVPRPIIRAILLLISHWLDSPAVAFDMRGTPAEMPHAVDALLANHRR